MIRLAKQDDLLEIATLGKIFFDLETAFGPLIGTYEIEYIQEVVLVPCNGPDSVLVVSENEGKIDGVFFAIILRNTMYQRQIAVAQEIIWHTDPALSPYRRMKTMQAVLEMGEWCLKMKGVKLSALGTRLSAPAAGKLLKKLGYSATGLQWHKELRHA